MPALNRRCTHEILEAIIRLIPPPKGEAEAPLSALIFDSKLIATVALFPMYEYLMDKSPKG